MPSESMIGSGQIIYVTFTHGAQPRRDLYVLYVLFVLCPP